MISFRQFLPDDLITNENIVGTEAIVVENIRASLAADDNPDNDNTHIDIEYKAGRNGTGEPGIFVIGTADADINPYPDQDREKWHVPGAIDYQDQIGE